MAAVMGTARTKPNPPHSQDQNIMEMVTERAFRLTRWPTNLGVRTLTATKCTIVTPTPMAMKGPVVSYCISHEQGRKDCQRHADIGNQAEHRRQRSQQQGVLKM